MVPTSELKKKLFQFVEKELDVTKGSRPYPVRFEASKTQNTLPVDEAF